MRIKGRKGRGAAAVADEAEAIFNRLVDDTHLREAVEKMLGAVGLDDAEAAPAQEQTQKKRRFGFGKMLLVAGVAGVGALVASESLRSKVLDLMFGSEEEFEYTPPTPDSTDDEAATTPLSAV